jgi:hypothetical protein
VSQDNLGTVADDDREQYAAEASRVAAVHDPDDAI